MQTLVDNRTASGLHGDAVVSWGFDGDVGGLRRRLCGTFSWSRLAEFTTMAPFKPGLKPLTDSRLVCREMERSDDTILIMSVTSAKCHHSNHVYVSSSSSCCRSRSDKDCFHHLTLALHLSLCCESDVQESIFMSLSFRFLLMVSLNRRRGRPLFL